MQAGATAFEWSTAHDLVSLTSHHRERKGLGRLNAANEIVRFDRRVVGWQGAYATASSEHVDLFGELATKSGYSSAVIAQAIAGRLLPESVCVDIVKGCSSTGPLEILSIAPGRNAAPMSESLLLREVLAALSAKQ
jgi:hypothetical protein